MIVDDIYSKNHERKLLEFNMRERGIISLKKALTESHNGPGMDALIEVHDPESVKNIFPDENVVLGYNRRNLKTLKMEDNSMAVYDKLKSYGLPIVLESGITSENINNLHIEKYQGLLIGSSLLSGDVIRW